MNTEFQADVIRIAGELTAAKERVNQLECSFRDLRRMMVAAGNQSLARYCGRAVTSTQLPESK